MMYRPEPPGQDSTLSGPDRQPPPAFPDMRIGLLGGSFNPAHRGHLHISLAAVKRLQLNKLWWLVTPGNPLKGGEARETLADRKRHAHAVAAHPKIEVTDFEGRRPSPYARDTIDFLQQRYAGVRFVWIMGADNLTQFHLWRGWHDIFCSIPILVADRPGSRHHALASPAARRFACARIDGTGLSGLAHLPAPAWAYLTLPLRDISSTAIRSGKQGSPQFNA